jgi:hypothetical protein
VEIDAVEQRPRNAGAVARHTAVVAPAIALAAMTPSAGTRIGSRDELEVGRKHAADACPGDGDAAILEHLAQRLKAATVELGQLVQEEHATMGQGDLPGTRRTAAAQQPGRASGVVRGPEGSLGAQRSRMRAQDAVDLRHLQRLLEAHRRQEAGQAPRQHRLARTRSPAQQQPVSASRGDLQRPLRALLAAHLGQVVYRLGCVRQSGSGGGQGRRAVEMAHHRTQIRGTEHAQARSQGGFGLVLGRNDELAAARIAQRHGHRQSAAYRPQAAVQRELSDQ